MKEQIFRSIEEIWDKNERLQRELTYLQEERIRMQEDFDSKCSFFNDQIMQSHRVKMENSELKMQMANYYKQITSLELEMVELKEKIRLYDNIEKNSLSNPSVQTSKIIIEQLILRDRRISELEKQLKDIHAQTTVIDKREIDLNNQRSLLKQFLEYAKKLSINRYHEAIAIHSAISYLIARKRISPDLINEELGKLLDDICTEDKNTPSTNINTGGGPAILGGNFNNTDFIGQKNIE